MHPAGAATGADGWPAPRAERPLDAEVRLPGSKSVTNRGLVLGALAAGTTVLRRPLASRDTRLMAAGLRTLGAEVDDRDDAAWAVTGNRGVTGGTVDVGNAGTVARFLPAVAALGRVPVRFDGDPRVRRRPIAPLLAALAGLGARVRAAPGGGLPATVQGAGGLPGGEVAVDAAASCQFVSALLLVASRAAAPLTVRATGRVPSADHLAMTVSMVRAFGGRVDQTAGGVWTVHPAPLRAGDLEVEPDLSSAAPFLAAALVAGGRVRLAGWPAGSHQPGARLPDLLARMGATCALAGDVLTVTGTGSVHGLHADLRDAGELVPVLAAAAALADGPSRFDGIGHLRGHETDRLAALQTELRRLGADVRADADGLTVVPAALHGGLVATYDDHRLAMAAAVLGLRVPGVLVENVGTAAKTLPDFAERWRRMVAG